MIKGIRTDDVKSKIDLIFNTFNELKKLGKQAKAELSSIDRELSNHYHKIEGIEINCMSDSHLLIMQLRDILYRRREAKINQTILDSFISSGDANLTKSKKRFEDIIAKHEEIIQEIKDRAK